MVGNYLYCSVYIVVALQGVVHIMTSVALALCKNAQVFKFLPQRSFWTSVLHIQVTHRLLSHTCSKNFVQFCLSTAFGYLGRKELKKLGQQHSPGCLKTASRATEAGLPETKLGLLDIC